MPCENDMCCFMRERKAFSCDFFGSQKETVDDDRVLGKQYLASDAVLFDEQRPYAVGDESDPSGIRLRKTFIDDRNTQILPDKC